MGLLRKIPESRNKSQESIKAARSWCNEAGVNLKSKSYRSCILTGYLAMFHAGRAVLFADGFREKSHFAIARYLEDKYARKGLLEKKWINLLDHYREMRHEDQYSTNFLASEDEARQAIHSAEEFIERMENLLR